MLHQSDEKIFREDSTSKSDRRESAVILKHLHSEGSRALLYLAGPDAFAQAQGIGQQLGQRLPGSAARLAQSPCSREKARSQTQPSAEESLPAHRRRTREKHCRRALAEVLRCLVPLTRAHSEALRFRVHSKANLDQRVYVMSVDPRNAHKVCLSPACSARQKGMHAEKGTCHSEAGMAATAAKAALSSAPALDPRAPSSERPTSSSSTLNSSRV